MASTLNNVGLSSGLSLNSPLAPASTPVMPNQPLIPGMLLAGANVDSPLGNFQALVKNISSSVGSFLFPTKTNSSGTPLKPNTPTASGKLSKIVQIDDFSSSYGLEIASLLTQNGDVELEQYDISQGGNRLANTSGALDQIIEKARNGQGFDAVNVSLASLDNSSLGNEVLRKIELISDLDIPVAIAANNNRLPGLQNSNFNLEPSTSLDLINIPANGATSSFVPIASASRNLDPLQGYSSIGKSLNLLM